MSVARFVEFRSAYEAMSKQAPECWVLVANPVTANFERTVIVAVFDTEAAAREYVRSAKLATPGFQEADEEENMCGGRISRTFRKDSLLWRFNPCAGGSSDEASMVERVSNPHFSWDTDVVAENPPPLAPEVAARAAPAEPA